MTTKRMLNRKIKKSATLASKAKRSAKKRLVAKTTSSRKKPTLKSKPSPKRVVARTKSARKKTATKSRPAGKKSALKSKSSLKRVVAGTKSAKKKTAPKNKLAVRKSASSKSTVRKRVAVKKRLVPKIRSVISSAPENATPTLDELGLSAELTERQQGLAGDLQGLSDLERAGSESVDELLEEGNAFEAGVVMGVEDADDDYPHEVRSHEVLEDDVPEEYLDPD